MATAIRKPTYQTRSAAGGASAGSSTVNPRRPHRPERPEIVYLVREPPTVFPYDDAVVHYNIKGDHHEGIFKGGVFSGFGVSYPQTDVLRIAPGYGSIWGRQFELNSAHDIDMSALTGVKYCVVYVEVNLKSATNQSASIKMIYAGAGYPDINTEDLIIKKQGVARMYLYSFEYNASGHLFSNVQQKFYQFGNGVAERARIMDADGIWNGRKVSDLFYYNADRFKKGNHAQYADLGKGFGSGTWLAVGDQLEIKNKNDDADIRSLLCVTKGAFIVDPPVGNLRKIGDIPLIREETTYKAYYSGGGNPLPNGAIVVGILITGSCKVYGWSDWDFINWYLGWKKINAYFGYNRYPYSPGYDNSRGGSVEQGAMYGGHLWYDGQKLLLVSWPNGTGGRNYGNIYGYVELMDPKELPSLGHYSVHDSKYTRLTVSQMDSINNNSVGTIRFVDINTKKPYVEVYMKDNAAFSGYFEFRLLYIKGEDRKGKEQTTYPWASLNPSLEGGQQ